jgi:hypothetical protein
VSDELTLRESVKRLEVNSDNVSQLGNKITTGIKGQLKNQAINNVESLVNKTANKYANSFCQMLECLTS